MSLIRFLSFGSRSLTKGAPPMGRYRLPDGRLIPEFGSGKNPFNPTSVPSQAKTSPATGVTAKAASTQAAQSSPIPFQTATRSNAGQGIAKVRDVVRRVWEQVGLLGRQMFQSMKRLPARVIARLPFRRADVAVPSSSVRPESGPVQGELSLENVRVVRNDLTDTDYEVVSAETSTASPVKRAPRTVPLSPRPLVPESRSLGRLADRLFSQKAP